MAVEIERKYLVCGDWKPFAVKSVPMVQAYISSSSGRTVRVRICGPQAFLTIKGPSGEDGLGRFEWEREIAVEDARELLTIAEPGRIEKTRHLVPAGDGVHTWEVDEFHGLNEGLVVAEIELRTPGDSFPRPSWLGKEVTGDRRYYNSALSKLPFTLWK